MKQRPKLLVYFSVFLALISAWLPMQIVLLYGGSPVGIAAKLSPLNWVVLALAGAFSVLSYQASPWVWAISPVFIVAVIWNNILVASAGLNYSPALAVLGSVIVVAAHGVLLKRDVRRLLSNPGLRWWRTPARKKLSLRARISPVEGGEVFARTFDVSKSGAYISLQGANLEGEALQNLGVGNHCALRLNLNQFRYLTCSAQIVRHSPQRGSLPAGFAVRFIGLSKSQRDYLDDYIEAAREPAPTQGAKGKGAFH